MRPLDAPPPRRGGASGSDRSDEKVTNKGSRIAEANGDIVLASIHGGPRRAAHWLRRVLAEVGS